MRKAWSVFSAGPAFGSAGSIWSTNFLAALRSLSMPPDKLRLVSTSRPNRKGRLVSRVKLLICWGRLSSVSVKSLTWSDVTRAPFLSRTVTGSNTSRAWTFRVAAGFSGGVAFSWLKAASNGQTSTKTERIGRICIVLMESMFTMFRRCKHPTVEQLLKVKLREVLPVHPKALFDGMVGAVLIHKELRHAQLAGLGKVGFPVNDAGAGLGKVLGV